MTMEYGIHRDIPPDVYHASPGVSPSRAKAARLSPKHYRHFRDHPKTPTPAMILGSAEHCAVLEPDAFALRYTVWTGGRRAGKEYDAFCAASGGRIVLSADDYERCGGMRRAVAAHAVAGPMLVDPSRIIEASLYWRDPATQLECHGRPDLLLPRAVVDLKTTRTMDGRLMTAEAIRFGYHISAAAYLDGLENIGQPRAEAILIYVESSPPFDVAVRPLRDVMLRTGRKEWHGLLTAIDQATESHEWPGVAEDEMWPMDLPAWADGAAGITLDGEEVP
jgi:hypothetical protein